MCVETDTSRIQSSIIVFVEAGVASVESNRLKERARRRTSPAWRILPRLDSVRAALWSSFSLRSRACSPPLQTPDTGINVWKAAPVFTRRFGVTSSLTHVHPGLLQRGRLYRDGCALLQGRGDRLRGAR